MSVQATSKPPRLTHPAIDVAALLRRLAREIAAERDRLPPLPRPRPVPPLDWPSNLFAEPAVW